MSALIASANDDGGPIRNFKVSFLGEDRGEMSFNLYNTFVDFLLEQDILPSIPSFSFMTVYVSGSLYRSSSNSVRINIDRLMVGRISLPQKIVDVVEIEVVKFVNSVISIENGFYIEEFKVREGEIYYRGKLPAEVEGHSL